MAASHGFHTTRWSVVLASHQTEPARARRALGELAEIYWYPLWGYARRFGLGVEDATDATQEFFCQVVERSSLAGADPERGRFRAYLRTAFRNFLVNRSERERAVKRGGGSVVLSIDAPAADERFGREPADDEAPDRAFDRAWARTLLARVVDRLASEWTERGDLERFEGLRDLFLGGGGESYAQAATRLGMSEGAVKVAVHRLRKRYKKLLTEEIADTLDDPGAVDEELGHLFRALGG